MTKIKLCGLSRIEDIEAANTLKPDFIGFVFAAKSKRRVSHLKAAELKSKLNPESSIPRQRLWAYSSTTTSTQ